MTSELEQILSRIEGKTLPPVHLWNPADCGEMDMLIKANGDWYHQGSKIQRMALVRLFSTILKKEEDQYFLITPVEKYRIQVEDAPFIAVEVDRIVSGSSHLLFRTNIDDELIADKDHQIFVATDAETGEPRPYVHVRDGLNALIHRNVFYQLVEWAQQQEDEQGIRLMISSGDQKFELGRL